MADFEALAIFTYDNRKYVVRALMTVEASDGRIASLKVGIAFYEEGELQNELGRKLRKIDVPATSSSAELKQRIKTLIYKCSAEFFDCKVEDLRPHSFRFGFA